MYLLLTRNFVLLQSEEENINKNILKLWTLACGRGLRQMSTERLHMRVNKRALQLAADRQRQARVGRANSR